MENFKNKLRLIGFVPIGALATSFAFLILFAISCLFLDWNFQDIMEQQIPVEKVSRLVWLINIPCSILGYKISHIIKPANLTNKNFITTHYFLIGLSFAFYFLTFFWSDNSTLQLNPAIGNLTELLIFTLIIKDRKFNLFNMR